MSELLNLLLGWKEILVTMDEKKYYHIKDKFGVNGIKYRTSIVSNQQKYRNRGLLLETGCKKMYYIYVKKNNYDKAVYIMNSQQKFE